MKTDDGVAKTIYFMLNTAFLNNEREKANSMLGMLQQEVNGEDLRLNMILGDIHFDRFMKIKERIKDRQYGRLYGSGYSTPIQDTFIPKEMDFDETTFHRMLMKKENRKYFFDMIGARMGSQLVHEYNMSPYGRCDFVIRDGRTWHVVEIKRGNAPTSVVSQIDRYRLCAELEMCTWQHDMVKATVIAQHFPPYVAGELSRLDVKMVSHSCTADSLKLVS